MRKRIRLSIGVRKVPLYEYVCPKCSLKFDVLRAISQVDEEASCPRCDISAKRVFSIFASFSKSDRGVTTPLTGSSCSSCSATSCDSCNL